MSRLMTDNEWLGMARGDLSEAVDFAREVAHEWGCRVAVRLVAPGGDDWEVTRR